MKPQCSHRFAKPVPLPIFLVNHISYLVRNCQLGIGRNKFLDIPFATTYFGLFLFIHGER